MNKKLLTMAMLSGIALSLSAPAAFAQGSGGQGGGQGGGGQRGGPPQEAFTACDSKSSGDSCSMETPEGSASGTCEMPMGDKLVCVPEGHSERSGGPPSQQ